MDYEYEIRSLAAETLALQTVLANVLYEVGRSNPELAAAVAKGFDKAADIVEKTAIIMGKSARPEHTIKALRIVEELRTVSVSNQGNPKHGV